ncbi:8943_t:CDS:2 [Ambispora leptoticha]|uniref:8943_t:CDS:1 n=1 Tax=Ambispora leptoticha TaxID=144679 RepID=A0A9N9BY85_9GLOM|nr:8943_t:CDS:2 [Ambispora leptoticha]
MSKYEFPEFLPRAKIWKNVTDTFLEVKPDKELKLYRKDKSKQRTKY